MFGRVKGHLKKSPKNAILRQIKYVVNASHSLYATISNKRPSIHNWATSCPLIPSLPGIPQTAAISLSEGEDFPKPPRI